MHSQRFAAPAGGTLRAMVRLALPFWRSERKWSAAILLALLLGNTSVNTYIALWYNRWTGDFMQAISQYDESKLLPLLSQFAWLLVATTAAGIVQTLASTSLHIGWRSWMTERYIGRWLSHQYYYEIERDRLLDNPDQRISEDVAQFVDLTTSLVLGLIGTIVSLASFAAVLWTLSGSLTFSAAGSTWTIPGYMVLAAVAYAFVTSWLTQVVGRQLMPLTFQKQRAEADFRYRMTEVRQGAEQIALYGGEPSEQRRLNSAFSALRSVLWGLMRFELRFGPFTNLLGFVNFVVPLFVALPKFLSHQIDFGTMTRLSAAFTRVNQDLSWFVSNYSQLQLYRAVVARLDQFDELLKTARERDQTLIRVAGPAHEIRVADLTLDTPAGQPLTEAINFSVQPGDRWIIRGSSGAGKSTLLRALAGIWPYGHGTISVPAEARMLFLSQKNYVPAGTLKAAVCYPSHADEFDDESVARALAECELTKYASRLAEDDQWGQRLSLGEQQRLAIARVLLHRPRFLFMDESTNAMDEKIEARLYALLRSRMPEMAIVSVTHHHTLDAVHDRTLVMPERGRAADLSRAATNQKRGAAA